MVYPDQSNDTHKPANFLYLSIMEETVFDFAPDDIHYLHQATQINADLELLYKFYTFNFWLDERFTFGPEKFRRKDKDDRWTFIFDMILDNTVGIGIDNNFAVGRIMLIDLNCAASLVTPTYGNMYFTVSPSLSLSGRYYFGLDWILTQSIPSKFVFHNDNSNLTSESTVGISYQLFRFFGPRNLKITFDTRYSVLLRAYFNTGATTYANIFEQKISTGIIWDFYNVSLSLYFIQNTTDDLTNHEQITNNSGGELHISYQIKNISFGAACKVLQDSIPDKQKSPEHPQRLTNVVVKAFCSVYFNK